MCSFNNDGRHMVGIGQGKGQRRGGGRGRQRVGARHGTFWGKASLFSGLKVHNGLCMLCLCLRLCVCVCVLFIVVVAVFSIYSNMSVHV